MPGTLGGRAITRFSASDRALGARLRRARIAAGLTQAQVAEALSAGHVLRRKARASDAWLCRSVGQSYVSKCERGERRVRPAELEVFATLLRCSVGSFFVDPVPAPSAQVSAQAAGPTGPAGDPTGPGSTSASSPGLMGSGRPPDARPAEARPSDANAGRARRARRLAVDWIAVDAGARGDRRRVHRPRPLPPRARGGFWVRSDRPGACDAWARRVERRSQGVGEVVGGTTARPGVPAGYPRVRDREVGCVVATGLPGDRHTPTNARAPRLVRWRVPDVAPLADPERRAWLRARIAADDGRALRGLSADWLPEVDAYDAAGQTPLYEAVLAEQTDAVSALLALGADVGRRLYRWAAPPAPQVGDPRGIERRSPVVPATPWQAALTVADPVGMLDLLLRSDTTFGLELEPERAEAVLAAWAEREIRDGRLRYADALAAQWEVDELVARIENRSVDRVGYAVLAPRPEHAHDWFDCWGEPGVAVERWQFAGAAADGSAADLFTQPPVNA